jgi:hypothetical protein
LERAANGFTSGKINLIADNPNNGHWKNNIGKGPGKIYKDYDFYIGN